MLDDARLYEDFPGFIQPAVIFHGTHDSVVPPQISQAFAAAHPNAALRLLESDHELLDVLETIWLETAQFLLR